MKIPQHPERDRKHRLLVPSHDLRKSRFLPLSDASDEGTFIITRP
jgi:hypothetical protein